MKKPTFPNRKNRGRSKGCTPWNKGIPRTRETREKLSKAHQGQKHSPEAKRKMSRAHKGRKRPPFSDEWRGRMSDAKKGQTPWNKGRPHLAIRGEGNGRWKGGKPKCAICGEEVLCYDATLCENCWLTTRTGTNNPNWRGGITSVNLRARATKKYKEWRCSIYERDNYTCQICGERGGSLRANHVKKFADYPELRLVKNNGITICEACDLQWVLNHEKEWESYFNFVLSHNHGSQEVVYL